MSCKVMTALVMYKLRWKTLKYELIDLSRTGHHRRLVWDWNLLAYLLCLLGSRQICREYSSTKAKTARAARTAKVLHLDDRIRDNEPLQQANSWMKLEVWTTRRGTDVACMSHRERVTATRMREQNSTAHSVGFIVGHWALAECFVGAIVSQCADCNCMPWNSSVCLYFAMRWSIPCAKSYPFVYLFIGNLCKIFAPRSSFMATQTVVGTRKGRSSIGSSSSSTADFAWNWAHFLHFRDPKFFIPPKHNFIDRPHRHHVTTNQQMHRR